LKKSLVVTDEGKPGARHWLFVRSPAGRTIFMKRPHVQNNSKNSCLFVALQEITVDKTDADDEK
jgi:hypothetical protein